MSKKKDDLFDIVGDLTTDFDAANKRAIAHSIRDHVKRGASVDTIASYKADALKTTLSFFRVSGRSRLTYKEDMAKRLIEVFGGDEDKHGKASRGEEEKVARRQEMDNLILKNINSKKKDKKKKKEKKKAKKLDEFELVKDYLERTGRRL